MELKKFIRNDDSNRHKEKRIRKGRDKLSRTRKLKMGLGIDTMPGLRKGRESGSDDRMN